MPETRDIELVEKARAGELEAFAELVRTHQVRILGLCASLLGDATQADDAAQEVFIKAYRGLSYFRGGCAFSTWLFRIAHNHCQDILRGRRPRSESWDELLETEGDSIERLLRAPDEERSREDADLVQRVLAALPDDYRLILLLREVQGFDYQEIAAAMSLSLDGVKARLKRARRRFAEQLRHFFHPEIV
jgi:RNA polymerase sigma-70 factor (ECF subfamily)